MDGNNVKCIFDQTNVDTIVSVSGLELEVFPEKPPAKIKSLPVQHSSEQPISDDLTPSGKVTILK